MLWMLSEKLGCIVIMFKRCVRCKSIWVCWNWLEVPDHGWGHECWNCAASWDTENKVRTGIPYFILKMLGDHFVEPGRFERDLLKDMEKIRDWGKED